MKYLKGLALDGESGRRRFNLGKLQFRLVRQEEALRTMVAETARLFASLGR